KKQRAKNAHGQEVKPVLNVPGSWKEASKHYRWPERAKAFDLWLIQKSVDFSEQALGDTYANTYKRVIQLDQLARELAQNMKNQTEAGTLAMPDYLLALKRLQSLLAQIQSEMRGLDDTAMRASIEAWQLTFLDEIEQAYHAESTRMEI